MLAKLRQGLQLIEFPPEHITDFFTQLIGMHEAALEGGRPKPVPLPVDAPAATAVQGAQSQAAELDAALTDRAELEALYAAAAQAPTLQVADAAAPEDFAPTKSPATADDQHAGVWMGKREAAEVGFVTEHAVASQGGPAQPNVVGQPTPAGHVLATAIPIGSWVELMLEGEWVRAQLTWASPHRTLYMFVASGGKAHSMSQRTMDKLRAQDQIRVISDGRLVEKALDAVAQTALQNSVDRS
jgi:Protein of unknown function (DUF1631)